MFYVTRIYCTSVPTALPPLPTSGEAIYLLEFLLFVPSESPALRNVLGGVGRGRGSKCGSGKVFRDLA